jgi:hypothetical protein
MSGIGGRCWRRPNTHSQAKHKKSLPSPSQMIKLDLGTNTGVAVAMLIAAVTALRRQGRRGGYAPKRGGASNTQVDISFYLKKKTRQPRSERSGLFFSP